MRSEHERARVIGMVSVEKEIWPPEEDSDRGLHPQFPPEYIQKFRSFRFQISSMLAVRLAFSIASFDINQISKLKSEVFI